MLKRFHIFLVIIFSCLSQTILANEQIEIDFTEIRAQATLANAAYQSEDAIRALLEARGYKLTHYHTIPGSQVTFFLATNEGSQSQAISIRGTANTENAMVNVSLKLKVDADTGVALHEGFAHVAKQVYAEVKPLLIPGYKIDVTGHSLGGAVAVILAVFLDLDQFDVDQVVTFGQPKVTNAAGARLVQHLDILRIVDPRDVVPLTPLFDPLDINNIDIYWHAGKEVILLEDNHYAILEGVDSMLRATKFTQQPPHEGNIRHHQMSAYINLIDTKTTSSVQVPYKTDLNLFNLFGSE